MIIEWFTFLPNVTWCADERSFCGHQEHSHSQEASQAARSTGRIWIPEVKASCAIECFSHTVFSSFCFWQNHQKIIISHFHYKNVCSLIWNDPHRTEFFSCFWKLYWWDLTCLNQHSLSLILIWIAGLIHVCNIQGPYQSQKTEKVIEFEIEILRLEKGTGIFHCVSKVMKKSWHSKSKGLSGIFTGNIERDVRSTSQNILCKKCESPVYFFIDFFNPSEWHMEFWFILSVEGCGKRWPTTWRRRT